MNLMFDLIKRLLCCGDDEEFKPPQTRNVAIQAPSQYGGSQYFTAQTSQRSSVRGSVRSDPSIHLPTHGSVHNSFNGTVPWSNHGSVRTSTRGSMTGSTKSDPFINNSFFEPSIYGGSARRTEYASYQRPYPPAKRNIRDVNYRSVSQGTLSSGDRSAYNCNFM
jgi:hypothetical protein